MKSLKTLFLFILSLTASSVMADNSAQHTSKASKHSVLAVTHGLASTAKIASATIAVPLVIVGSASLSVGTSIATSAISHGPLEITETTITKDPAPNMAMQLTKEQ
ncbi:hypothetical protein [Pseudoalteromonas denitrificans]|uniref:Uncharacterized protein n=1 Tax=Pseudoalteromonas denitrificans DSM 6059 TaxID=1123010 RepID=A0A1I1PYH0_9GAMM|nr:hypothetical protein [Pseudoalteromonas denitrificans]SFD14941.1 hypothetical protein SAMN02745724_03668 [Pseudoalteromonas denitrificans DSM 6059]